APRAAHLRLQALVAIVSIGLFAVNEVNFPWSDLAPLPTGRIARTEAALDVLLAQRQSLGKIIVDDSVASLRAGAFSKSEFRNLLDFTSSEISRADALLSFERTAWMKSERARLIDVAPLTWSYTIAGTSLTLHSRNAVTDPTVGALLTTSRSF